MPVAECLLIISALAMSSSRLASIIRRWRKLKSQHVSAVCMQRQHNERVTGWPRAPRAAAANLPLEKRDAFLERVAAHLRIRLGTFTDADVAQAAETALRGLVHNPAASERFPLRHVALLPIS